MTERKIRTLLTKIGLSQLEIDCYVALLKRSPQKASELARKLDTPKATVLLALQALRDRYGFIKSAKRKNAFLFVVEDIKSISGYLDRQVYDFQKSKQEADNLLPALRSMQNYDASKPSVYYFEGKDGIKQAYEQVLSETDHFIGYGSHAYNEKYLPGLFPDYYERRSKKGITVEGIVPALAYNIEQTQKFEHKHLRKTHLVPKEWSFPIEIDVYKGTVIFYSYDEMYALMIKSKAIADCLYKVFELAFKGADSYDKKIREEIPNTK